MFVTLLMLISLFFLYKIISIRMGNGSEQSKGEYSVLFKNFTNSISWLIVIGYPHHPRSRPVSPNLTPTRPPGGPLPPPLSVHQEPLLLRTSDARPMPPNLVPTRPLPPPPSIPQESLLPSGSGPVRPNLGPARPPARPLPPPHVDQELLQRSQPAQRSTSTRLRSPQIPQVL